MKNENFEEILKKLHIENGKWYLFSDIDSIILKDGRGIYPNWRKLRFLVDSGVLLVQHGSSEQYGARLSGSYSFSWDGTSLTFNPGSIVIPDYITGELFRNPKAGDIIRVGSDKNRCVAEVMVNKAYSALNGFFIQLSNGFQINEQDSYRFSFYDPTLYNQTSCIHGTEEEGIYMRFIPNSGKTHKKYGVFQEKILIKDIEKINLKLKTNKTYSLT